MTKEYCDICGADVKGHNFKDLLGGREYRIIKRRTCDDSDETLNLTLCRKCNKCLVYFMLNRMDMKTIVERMSLGNRIRYLLMRPLKLDGGEEK